MKVKFLKESTVLGCDSEKLRKTLLKHTSQSIANSAAHSFAQNDILSDGFPSTFAFSKVDGYPVIIKSYSFYKLFKNNTKFDCYVAVYVIKDDNLVRLAANSINSFSPSKARSVVMSLSKCTTLKGLLDKSLSFGLKKAFKVDEDFPELV